MHPLLARRNRLMAYIALWLPVAALLASALALRGGFPWATAGAIAAALVYAYAFACLATYYLCRAMPLRLGSVARITGTHVATAAVSASVWALALQAEAWLAVLTGFAPEGGADLLWALPALSGAGFLLFLLASALHYAFLAYEASRQAETRAVEFQLLSRDAELKTLRAQIHPHFLFNALNSINALISSDPAAARRTCLLLGDFLRKSLTFGAREGVTLAEELALAESLLAIEGVRFGDRLRVQVDVDDAARACLVPPLILQPLVENAVTHGIGGLIEGGLVRIEARLRAGRLEVAIENPRDPEGPRRRSGAGVGLDNVRRRLDALYGREAEVAAAPQGARFRALVALPGRPQSR